MKNNKLIAEFMGFTSEKNIGWYDNNMMMPQSVYDSQDGNCFDDLLFDKSWDWLMPVIEKIGDHTLSYTIEMLAEYYYKDGDNQDGLDGIEEFYQAVVFWIKENNINIKDNYWQMGKVCFGQLVEEKQLDHGKWFFYYNQPLDQWEAIMNGCYLHVFKTLKDLMFRKNEIDFFQYDMAESEKIGEEVLINSKGQARKY